MEIIVLLNRRNAFEFDAVVHLIIIKQLMYNFQRNTLILLIFDVPLVYLRFYR